MRSLLDDLGGELHMEDSTPSSHDFEEAGYIVVEVALPSALAESAVPASSSTSSLLDFHRLLLLTFAKTRPY